MSVDSRLDEYFDLQQLGQLHPVLADVDRTPHTSAQDATLDVGSYGEVGQYRITANTTLSSSFASTAPEDALGTLMRGQVVTVQKVLLVGEIIRAQVAGEEGSADCWCTLANPAAGTRFAVKSVPDCAGSAPCNPSKHHERHLYTVVRKRVRVRTSASAEAATICWLKQGEWVYLSSESFSHHSPHWWALVTRPVTGWIELADVADGGFAVNLAVVRGRLVQSKPAQELPAGLIKLIERSKSLTCRFAGTPIRKSPKESSEPVGAVGASELARRYTRATRPHR